MDVSPVTIATYVERAFDRFKHVADGLGDDRVNERPLGPGTNAVAALVVHCCGMTEWWLGHVLLGRPSQRDRAGELTTRATVAELHAMLDRTYQQTVADLRRIEAGEATGGRERDLPDRSDGSVVLHVLEELFQHLGHAELAADALG